MCKFFGDCCFKRRNSFESRLVTTGAISDALEKYISACEARKSVNAFTHLDYEGARAKAAELDGTEGNLRLKGRIIAVKDTIDVGGMPCTGGTAALKNHIPVMSNPTVQRLQNAGAIILGKTGTHELSFGITSNNYCFGAIRNPYDESKIPGGSSGGSAAAVAAGMVWAALGEDTGGSARVPAALCGTVGYRPTFGRYSDEGMIRLTKIRDVIGPITRTVADAVLLDGVMTDRVTGIEPANLNKLRFAVPKGSHWYEGLDSEVARVTEEFLRNLEAHGVTLVEKPLFVKKLADRISIPWVLHETRPLLAKYLATHKIDLSVDEVLDNVKSPDVRAILGAPVPSHEVAKQLLDVDRPELQSKYKDYFQENDVDAIIFPTSPITARNIEGINDGVKIKGVDGVQGTFGYYIRNTDPNSTAGIPGISLPAGISSDGLPVGIELDAPFHMDDKLLSIALAIEKAGLLQGGDHHHALARDI